MKARIVLLLLVCLSCTVVAHENGDDFISPWGQISFTGHWKGDVSITISKANQVVYSHSLLINNPKKYSISVEDYFPGVYLLELTNSYGGYIYGVFEVK